MKKNTVYVQITIVKWKIELLHSVFYTQILFEYMNKIATEQQSSFRQYQ